MRLRRPYMAPLPGVTEAKNQPGGACWGSLAPPHFFLNSPYFSISWMDMPSTERIIGNCVASPFAPSFSEELFSGPGRAQRLLRGPVTR